MREFVSDESCVMGLLGLLRMRARLQFLSNVLSHMQTNFSKLSGLEPVEKLLPPRRRRSRKTRRQLSSSRSNGKAVLLLGTGER